MFKKSLASAGVFVLLAGGVTFAAVQSASAAPVKPGAVGVCVNKTTAAVRLLESGRLAKSQYGKCKSTERKVLLPTVAGLPKIPAPPATIVYKRTTGTETCTKTTDAVLTYECKTVPAAPAVKAP